MANLWQPRYDGAKRDQGAAMNEPTNSPTAADQRQGLVPMSPLTLAGLAEVRDLHARIAAHLLVRDLDDLARQHARTYRDLGEALLDRIGV